MSSGRDVPKVCQVPKDWGRRQSTKDGSVQDNTYHSIDMVLSWLLESDPLNPGVRYFALRDLLHRPKDDSRVIRAQEAISQTGPVPAILEGQHPDGYWARPGGGHAPSYTATVWQIIFLAELGASRSDERVQRGCDYLLDHMVAANGGFAMNPRPVPSSVVHCLNGDPLHALLRLGYLNDARVQSALDWQVQAITGEGDVRFYRSGTSGRGFACAYNQRQPCAWGATKALKALSIVPPDQVSPAVTRAIEVAVNFLLGRDLSRADYPYSGRVNSSWFSFGFPLGYRSDVLETMLTLTGVGHGDDPRLGNARQFILSKPDDRGRWTMEKSLNGKMWVDIEEKGQPSKWITLRALLALGLGPVERSGGDSSA
jgi:hypothetical protein